MASTIKVDNIQDQCGTAVISKCGATHTVTAEVYKQCICGTPVLVSDQYYTSTWYLTSIESADGKDVINFEYNPVN